MIAERHVARPQRLAGPLRSAGQVRRGRIDPSRLRRRHMMVGHPEEQIARADD